MCVFPVTQCLSVSASLSDHLSVSFVECLPPSPVVRPWEKEGREECIVTMEEALDFNRKVNFDVKLNCKSCKVIMALE